MAEDAVEMTSNPIPKESVVNPLRGGGAGESVAPTARKYTMHTEARDTALETLEGYAAYTYANPVRMARRGSGGPRWGIGRAVTFIRKVKGPATVKGWTAEHVAQALSLALMDKDGDGVISQEEKDETTQKMVDECNNLLVNLGVVGALILSIVFPMCLQDYSSSEANERFFGEGATDFFLIAYHSLIMLTTVCAIMVVCGSLFMYKHLNFFMVTSEMRAWWLSTINITPVVGCAQVLFLFMIVAVPFGAASTQSPKAALISVVGLVVFLVMFVYILLYESWLIAAQHNQIQQHVRELKAKEQ